ncbi:Alpha/Beta hydrolase protein [Umbelopsis sp. AD052]|nr:Alpha/Beta hydrolase protein [Umbelopsis sp. AD052]
MISYTLFDLTLELANAPTPTESTWLRRVHSLPAKGTWIAPNVAKNQNIKEWIMDSNTADIIIFWIHGGGFVFGSDTMYAPALIQLVKQLTNDHKKNVRLFSLQYKLAPKHKWPTAPTEILECYRNLVQQLKIPACKIIVAGDSAGGGMAVSLINEIMKESLPLPRAALLVSPWVNLDLASPTYQTLAKDDYLTLAAAKQFRTLYLPKDMSPTDPRISPIFLPSLQLFPPMLVIYGATEVFSHDIAAFVKKCRKDGVEVDSMAPPDSAHVWFMMEHLCANDGVWHNAMRDTANWCAQQFLSSADYKRS